MVLLVVILALTLVLLVTQAVRLELTALGIVAALGLSGILTASEALAGFANPATITVGAMLVLSAGLERAGVVDLIGGFLMRWASGSVSVMLLVLSLPIAVLSAFMNNTAIVALMIPVVLAVCQKSGRAPSKLLIPISYVSILGGTCTLIGTSTNILVDSLYRQAGGPGFTMFEFGGLGLVYLVVGGAFVVFFLPRLLPERTSLSQLLDAAPADHFVSEVRVPPDGNLIGRTLDEVFGREEDILVIELVRQEEVTLRPAASTVLQAEDVLLVEGTAKTIHDLINRGRFLHGTAISDGERETISRIDLSMVEAVLTPNSQFLHTQVRDLGLSRRLGISVLAVRRLGRHHQYNLRKLRLRSGDVLLLQGERRSFQILQEEGNVLLIEGVEKTLTFSRKAPLALGILGAVGGLAAFNVAPIVLLAVAGVIAMLATGCLTMRRATRALDPSVLLLLAGMIPLGTAMEKTGLAALIAEFVVAEAGARGPVFLIGALYLLTTLMSSVISNGATAVLLTPLCLGIAANLGIDPKPLLIALTFGASASFATPVGYQTNTMVMGPGGYLFRDYLRAGLPLNLVLWLTATFLIPYFWPP